MLHPAFQGRTLDGTNSKENVAKFLSGGHILDSEGFIFGPNAFPSPIPENLTQPAIKPELIILHSNAGPTYSKWQALIAFIKRADVDKDFHFDVDLDGKAAQAISIFRRADCNYKANRFLKNGKWCGAISFETADKGYPTLENTEWNFAQLETLIGFSFLFCVACSISCQACPSPYSSGIDYHSKFKEWSNVTGKTCPGAARIRQMDYVRTEVAKRLAEYYRQCGGSCPGT